MKKQILFPIMILCLTLFCGCEKKPSELNGFSMDAPYRISVTNLSFELESDLKNYMDNIDAVFNAYREDSTLSLLNHHKKLTVSKDDKNHLMLYDIVKQTLPYCNKTFDISIRPISELWDFQSNHPKLPDDTTLQQNLKSVDFHNIVLEDDYIYLENNAKIELGAVAKGYVCDRIVNKLNECQGLVDIGGTIAAVGKDITAGIKSPDKNGLLCSFTLPSGKKVATSGSYERFFELDGKNYHHILDPKTGFPVDSPFVSVTVISDSALEADILSTTLFASTQRKLPEHVEAIFVSKTYNIYCTDGISDFKMLQDNYIISDQMIGE